MNRLIKLLRVNNNFPVKVNLRFLCFKNGLNQLPKPILKKPSRTNTIEPLGWFLLIIPASAFGLGVWQVQRKSWKENLIRELKEQANSNPVQLPEDLTEVDNLEYRPVHVRGKFLHDKEIYMGPRSLLVKGDASTQSALFSGNSTSQGYLVITPFKLEDREETILVNRGWIPSKKIDPKTRLGGQTDGVVDVIGVVRLNENRPVFTTKNQSSSKLFFYRDLPAMCSATGALPIYLDQTGDFNTPEGPIGGQTRIALRNEHLSYILTWFSLSGATGYMWYKKFLSRSR
ncbi:hypothetical protein GWI33_011261 [Rhynchophorus ferrugineus]|uniref:SURF1-like protein n=1 Tax=Rhynchophorus ferrugineus TaxID=354439 RepID=A0A834MEV5_RHYFE|nr:hypothetical protein GWI33_011261 [Rhynchophorus ferrugineus]